MKRESYYRDLLAKQVGGKTEVTLPFGRADVMTSTTVYEVEPIARWRAGASQALQYSAQVAQQGALAVYGRPELLAKVYTGLQSLPPPRLELWWLEGEKFVYINSYERAGAVAPDPRVDEDVFKVAVRDLALNGNFAHSAPLRLALLELLGYETDQALDALGLQDSSNRCRARKVKRRALSGITSMAS